METNSIFTKIKETVKTIKNKIIIAYEEFLVWLHDHEQNEQNIICVILGVICGILIGLIL